MVTLLMESTRRTKAINRLNWSVRVHLCESISNNVLVCLVTPVHQEGGGTLIHALSAILCIFSVTERSMLSWIIIIYPFSQGFMARTLL